MKRRLFSISSNSNYEFFTNLDSELLFKISLKLNLYSDPDIKSNIGSDSDLKNKYL